MIVIAKTTVFRSRGPPPVSVAKQSQVRGFSFSLIYLKLPECDLLFGTQGLRPKRLETRGRRENQGFLLLPALLCHKARPASAGLTPHTPHGLGGASPPNNPPLL